MRDAELVPELAVIGMGEGNSWWLGRFKGVFRYRFGRLNLEDRWFNFIPRGER